MIAHVAIRRIHIVGDDWLYAHGWVLGSASGSGLATSRAKAIRKACIEAVSAGAGGIAAPSHRDLSAVPPSHDFPLTLDMRTHHDPAAVAVALRAASVELMRECIRRHGAPDLPGAPDGVIDALGGTVTVADVLGCDPAQVCRWRKLRRLPLGRVEALRRELAALA